MKVPNSAPMNIGSGEEVFGMEEFDIHHHKRTLEAKLRWLDRTDEVNGADKQLILEFYKDSVARGLSITRNIKYLILLSQLSKMLKVGFKNATKTNMKDLVVRLEHIISGWVCSL